MTTKSKLKSRRNTPGPKPGTINPRLHGAGRKKGTPNALTRDVREALVEFAIKKGGRKGLVGYFEKLHKIRPDIVGGLIGKLIPQAAPATDSSLTAAFIKLLSQDRRMIDVTPAQKHLEHK